MPPVTLEGDTLGKKHQHYNKLVEDAVANKDYKLCKISDDDSDIDNLLKIDIASKNRNVDYIIEVMKSNDMLYAATAIKKSTWLITEQQYANIINPEYLHTELLPNMNTKTFNKLMLHIRLNLKDESRVETFYEYLTATQSAHEWLENCSIPFIEDVIRNKRLIPLSLFKRLCKRSPHFIEYYTRVTPGVHAAKREILFLLKSHTEDVLNVLERDNYNLFPELGKKKTEIVMKTCPQKVFDNFEILINNLDLSVVAKYLNKKETKTFLHEQMKKFIGHFICYDKMGHFIKNMPEEERFEFVKKTFIDKTELADFYPEYKDGMIIDYKSYLWYEYAPFNMALKELKTLIRKEHSPFERCAMLKVLITCAIRKAEHIKTLLVFVKEKHINEPFKFKIDFVNNLLSQISAHELDVETWNILDQLFHSMEVYTESENDVQICLESIILYKVLHDEQVPKIVEQKMTFSTFEKIKLKLNQEQNSKMFTYLLNSVFSKVQSKNIANVSDFSETVVQLKNTLTLIKDWKKDVSKYPFVLEKIQELIKIKQDNMWKADMCCLYNIKKSWRKHMFEESLSLCLCEETCLNALKHKPQLLTRHDEEIDTLRTNDAVSLQRLLAKLRVYWSHSLAQHWTKVYLQNLNKTTGKKAIIKGLFMLLSQNQIVDLAKQHIPDDNKIIWGETDQNDINIRKNIAKHLHVARSLIPLDTVLWYAKGDYLQYTVPSLNAILPNLSDVESRKYLPRLLDAPVSLQKFGLNLAVSKLKSNDLKSIFLKMWKTSKNLTIRSALFKHTYAQILRMAHKPIVQKELWEILSMFIDNLTAEESAEIYKIFGDIENVHIGIRKEFYMKSYEFLTSLPASANCEKYVKTLIEYAPKIMDHLDEDFVINKMLSPSGTKFCSYGCEVLEVFACYVLCGKNEEDQIQRFRRVIVPAMEEAFHLWNNVYAGGYYVKENFNNFLSFLILNFRIYYLTKKSLPVQLFVEIQTKIVKELPLIENYVLCTNWKLVVEYVKTMEESKSTFSAFDSNSFTESQYGSKYMSNEITYVWKDLHSKISPSWGPIIVKHLKEDTEQCNFSTIYCLFAEAFEKFFDDLGFYEEEFILGTLKHMLNYDNFEPTYFLASKVIPKNYIWRDFEMGLEIRRKIQSHPSKAVRTHFYNDCQNFQSRYHDL